MLERLERRERIAGEDFRQIAVAAVKDALDIGDILLVEIAIQRVFVARATAVSEEAGSQAGWNSVALRPSALRTISHRGIVNKARMAAQNPINMTMQDKDAAYNKLVGDKQQGLSLLIDRRIEWLFAQTH